jgi:hypothetical protein
MLTGIPSLIMESQAATVAWVKGHVLTTTTGPAHAAVADDAANIIVNRFVMSVQRFREMS